MATVPAHQVKPLLKWAGGKRQVLPAIRPLVPASYKRYIEPFLGGGAVLFDIKPRRALVNDINKQLIDLYQVVRDQPEQLIDVLAAMPLGSEAYYEIRNWDREATTLGKRSPTELAARTIYLNRTGFNGLYRVNSRNEFNVPYGRHTNPTVCDAPLLRAVSRYFNDANVTFYNEDFRKTVARARAGDFLYVDPPYAPLDAATSTFTSYTSGGFSQQDLVDLRDALDVASSAGATWVLSNVESTLTRTVFPRKKYRVTTLQVTRPISSSTAGRAAVTEILVRPLH